LKNIRTLSTVLCCRSTETPQQSRAVTQNTTKNEHTQLSINRQTKVSHLTVVIGHKWLNCRTS